MNAITDDGMRGPIARPAAHDGRKLGTLALLMFVWLALSTGARPLILPDEGRYVGVAWEMLRSGDWLTPTLNGLPFFHKPPLFYWITAASMSVFGVHEWAARLAPLLGGWGGAMATYLFIRRWVNERAARLTLLVLAVHPLFFVGSQFANMDMLVAGCITATICLLAHAAMCMQQQLPWRRALAAAYAVAALGVLAKGLIGVVIPALVVGTWLLAGRRWACVWRLMWLPGCALFLVIAAPWFVVMQWRFPDFLHYFIIVQHFQRFAAGGFNNVQPFWFYPAVLVAFSLPWLFWLGLRWRQRRDQGLDNAAPGLRSLTWIWLVAVVLFFSLPRSKPLGYVLPAVAPLGYLLADTYARLAAPSLLQRRLWWGTIVTTALCCLAAAAFYTARPGHSNRDVALALRAQWQPGQAIVMLGNYFYDVALYARLRGAVAVVDDWDNPDVQRSDNWQRELADAGQFSTPAGRANLLTVARLPPYLCAAPIAWVLASPDAAQSHAFLRHARLVQTEARTSLWRLDLSEAQTARELGCAHVAQLNPVLP